MKQISLNKNKISKYVKVLVPDYESYMKVHDKRETYKICKEEGIAVLNRYTDEGRNIN